MDQRKVQSVGGGTYTVSLPKAWGNAHGVAPGDTVNVHQHRDGVLVIQPQEPEPSEETGPTVRIAPEETTRLEATLRAAYAAGCRQLTLEATDEFTAAQRRIVDEVSTNLTGVSVADRSPTEIVVRVLLDSDKISVSQSVRQLTFVALSMHELAMDAVTAGTAPTTITSQDDQADRLAAMVDRSFILGQARPDEGDALGHNRPALFELWGTTRELERVADHAERIATVAPELDGSVPEAATDDLRRVAGETRTLVSDAVGLIVDEPDAEAAHEILRTRDGLREEIDAAARAAADGHASLWPVCESVRRTAEHGGNIAELGLQKAIRTRESTEPAAEAADISTEQ